MDPNVLGLPDTLWDGTNLFAVVLESGTEAKLYKYSYAAGPQPYALAPGFPVSIPLTGLAVSAVVAKDTTGKLWIAYAGAETGAGGDSSIHVIWSTSTLPEHQMWNTTGVVLESATATNQTDVASIVSFNDGSPKIGVVWSNQRLGEYAFRYHLDGTDENTWNAKEIVDGGATTIATEEFSIAATPDGRVLVVGTDLVGNGHLNFYVRSTDGTWSARVPVNSDATSQPSRPLLLVDTDNNAAYCVYRDSTYNKSTFFTRTSLSGPISFSAPNVLISAKASDGTTTKQYVTNTTDLIAAASQNGEIFWNILDLSGPPIASFQADMTSGNAPLIVSFTDTSTDDVGIVSRNWNFGDGYTSTATNPVHVFRAGTWNVTLQVTDTGGATASANQSITAANVGNPVIQAITPATVNKNIITADFPLTVDGDGFVNGATVQFNGTNRVTSFVSATKLTATITLADVATAGAFPITVVLPSSAVSNAMNLTVVGDNPAPTISTISPTTVAAGSAPFNLTVNGTGFISTSVVWVNGTERLTNFVSPTQLTTNISSIELATGLYQIPVWVVNAPPGGGTSNTAYFDITPVCATPVAPASFAGNSQFNTVHSQLWYNDGRWWGAFSDGTAGIYFWSLSNGTVTKGAQILANTAAGPDTFWNGTDLFLLIYETSSQAKFYKYSYDSVGKTYTLTSGFPVTIPLTGLASALTFAQDSTGKLWATYTGTNNSAGIGDGKVHVIWTTSPDHLTWDTTGVVLESGLSVLLTETSAITPFGGNKIGVTWTNQVTNEIGFRVHTDGDPETETFWSMKEVVDSGVSHATEYINLKGLPDGRVFLGQLDNIGNRHFNLFRRNAGGTWDAKIPVTRDPISKPKNPLVLYDETNNDIYVAFRDSGKSSYVYFSRMNADSNLMPASCPMGAANVSNPTSTKQSVNGLSDLAIAARASNEVIAVLDLAAAPAAAISIISPDFATAGDPDFVMTVNGTNFKASSVVQFDGINCPTTFISSTQLTAQISALDIAAGGLFPVTVATPGELDSNSVIFSVDNLAPTLTNIFPVSIPAGSAPFDLTATGTNFNAITKVRFNGVDHPVTFVSSTEVHAQIAADEIGTSGIFPVEIFNPAPGGGLSFAMTFSVEAIIPTLTALTPSTAIAGGPAFTLTLDGTNFTPSSVVKWNGSDRVTTFVNSTRLTAQITAADILSGGSFPVVVTNPGSVGSTSGSINFAVNNPQPQITNIAPATATAGAAAFTLTINGSGFVPASVVRFNGDLPANEKTAVFVNSTQLTVGITAADIAAAGTFPITVFNPLPGGGVSSAVNLTVNNPAPTLTSISPTTVTSGSADFPLTVNGTNFNAASVVRINGFARTTTFVSSTQLTTQITAAEVAAVGTISVAVFNPLPGGGASSLLNLQVNNAAPTIVSISPTSKSTGDAGFTLTVNGTNFNSGSVVRVNTQARVTSYVNATQLQAQIPATDLATAGSANISVFNPAPGGGTSSTITLVINNALPVITGISPATAIVGGSAFTLTVNGTGFVSGSIVRLNNADRTTSFVSSTQLTAQIAAADIAATGIANITVFSPTPGGGTAIPAQLAINNPVPTLTSISPTTKTTGAAAFTLTVNGTLFKSSSVVRFSGSDRPTIFVSSTQLTAQISAADVSSGGVFAITVFTPAPGGGTSNSSDLSVNNPLPIISNIAPATALQGGPDFLLTVNGTGFVNTSVVTWNGQNRTTNFISSTQLGAQIPAADIAAVSTANVAVINPAPAGGTSNQTSFTIAPNPRLLSILSSTSASGSTANIAIQLVAQGDENALGFSLNYDTTLLSNPTATVGADSSGATLNLNTSQVAQGHYGVALSLPSGMSFAAGTRQLVVVSFTLATVASATPTQITFGNAPVVREVANAAAEVLPTAFVSGTLTIVTGFEGDVSPRPNGNNNGSVSIADWVQIGRFAAGVDVVSMGSEFQKADCAPRSGLGNGSITVSDWVQAGRFASGLDPTGPAGGPSAPSASSTAAKDSNTVASASQETRMARVVRVREGLEQAGERTVQIELDAQGGENALAFNLMFDPEQFRFTSATKGNNAETATLQVNQASAGKGRIGVALALPAGRSFGTGTNQLVVLSFSQLQPTREAIALAFTDLPIAQELVGVDAGSLKVRFEGTGSAGTNPIDNAQYFVYQQYLDILGRAPDAEGLDYWTSQITACGSDASCVQSRRVAVSNAFFFEREFQTTGAYVYRIYKAAVANPPGYAQFMRDRLEVTAGPQLDKSKTEFANSFVQRAAFNALYPSTMGAAEYVEALAANTGNALTPAEKYALVSSLEAGTDTRATVLRKVAENPAFSEHEYNSAFVLMQYFGYLRRDPDTEGFDFWLGQMNRYQLGDIETQRALICSFLTSAEYQLRFGSLVTRSNGECAR
ncbi:MAG TPA: IPT/TIG domain-containing protein [Pyrinomonadaceae bacterium]|nr:IPT/TIG domain-containing protein [Pyrinomonadaceae bacterium]